MSLDEPFRFDFPGGGPDDDEEDADAVEIPESTGTFEDLLTTADPAFFDRTFEATKSDVPLGATETIPIPRPWQGIPRVAMVFNFNYVYDAANEVWVRQNPRTGGGAAAQGTLATASSLQTIGTSGQERIEWDTAVFDDASWLDTANNEIVVDQDGLYLLNLQQTYRSDPTPPIELTLEVNGNLAIGGENTSEDDSGQTVSRTARLSSGDVLAAYTQHNDAGNVFLDFSKSQTLMK